MRIVRNRLAGEREDRINPEVLVIARESRGLTQSELARRLAITQGALSKIEGGVKSASPDVVTRLAQILDYPEQFFFSREPVFGLGVGNLYHRKRQALSAATLARVHAQVNIRRIHIFRMLNAVEPLAARFARLDLEDHKSPEQVARVVRAKWLLPDGPLRDLTKAIEDAGGIVIRYDFGTSLIDAVSQWPPDMPPMFFVNESVPGDRLRYSLAHELGHILMHESHSDEMEKEADRFAAELLMPARDICPQLEPVTLPRLATLKPYWKVSMAALLKRASDLGRLTQRQTRYFWMQMGQLGYRKREPVELDIPIEQPTSLEELIRTHREDLGYSMADLSALLTAHEGEIRSLYLGQRRHLKLVHGHAQLRGATPQ
jgi:Zn-dependent peptidase ImmA (M78 family)/plasmid maintenance system antidote protein VapI